MASTKLLVFFKRGEDIYKAVRLFCETESQAQAADYPNSQYSIYQLGGTTMPDDLRAIILPNLTVVDLEVLLWSAKGTDCYELQKCFIASARMLIEKLKDVGFDFVIVSLRE